MIRFGLVSVILLRISSCDIWLSISCHLFSKGNTSPFLSFPFIPFLFFLISGYLPHPYLFGVSCDIPLAPTSVPFVLGPGRFLFPVMWIWSMRTVCIMTWLVRNWKRPLAQSRTSVMCAVYTEGLYGVDRNLDNPLLDVMAVVLNVNMPETGQ